MASKVDPTKLCTSEGPEASAFSSVTKNCSCSIALNTLEYHDISAIQHGSWTVDTIWHYSVELAVEYTHIDHIVIEDHLMFVQKSK